MNVNLAGYYLPLLLALSLGLVACGDVSRGSAQETPALPETIAVVIGEVISPDGTAIPAAEIERVPLDPGSEVADFIFLTDTAGTYRLDLEPGWYEIQVKADGYHPQTKKIFAAGGEITEVDFMLDPTS